LLWHARCACHAEHP